MAKKRRDTEEMPELNLKPAMNMILILIPLLLLAMESVKISVINVATPKIGPSPNTPKQENTPDEVPLKLTLALTDRGITVFAKGQTIENANDHLAPTFPKIDGEGEDAGKKVYDWVGLSKKLADLKEKYSTERNVTISAEPNIKYKTIIKAMDVSRQRKGDDGKEFIEMFPDVVLSAGVA